MFFLPSGYGNTFRLTGSLIGFKPDCVGLFLFRLEVTADNITLKSEDAGNPVTISREEGFSGKNYGTNTDTSPPSSIPPPHVA